MSSFFADPNETIAAYSRKQLIELIKSLISEDQEENNFVNVAEVTTDKLTVNGQILLSSEGEAAMGGLSSPPTGAAGGDLSGTYPNPQVVNDSHSHTASTLPATTVYTTDSGTVTSTMIANGTITDTDVAAANKDGAAGTASMRTLGTGAAQAAAGNDSRLSDARTPTSHATSHKHGGSDEVSTATATANAIPKADASAKLDTWISDSTTSTKGKVQLEGTAANILMNGTQAAGANGVAADSGHVHPTDTSRAPTASPTFTGNVDLGQAVFTGATISPTQLTADQNDYAPTNFATCQVVRQDVDATGRALTGLAGGSARRLVLLINIGASGTITLKHLNTSSASANRFNCPGAVDYALTTRKSVWLWYDGTSGNWRVLG